MIKITRCRAVLKFALTAALLSSVMNSYASELTLAVANSTCSAIKKVGALYQQQHDIGINYICKSSGRLAKGLTGKSIEADIFISANRKWMDYMTHAGNVEPSLVTSPWGNELVVATPVNSKITDFEWKDVASDDVQTILIGDPGTAPFGRYAKQSLESTGFWEKVRNKIATKKHITLLAEVLSESNANTIGILFLSNVNDSHRVIYSIDKSWHSPIRYYLAPIKNSRETTHTSSLLSFIQSEVAKEVFLAEGFKVEN